MNFRHDESVAMHPRLFSGKLGCITDVKVKLDIDPNVRPLKQSLRPVAIHLRDAVERELLKQLQQGIIERVEVNSDPSTWITNLVPVIKDRVKHNADEASKPIEVRLTTDSRVQNKAIRRARHPGKTIEELVYLVNGSNIFSKLDITKAFHQLELDEDSRNLTTITTHIGLFSYKRLHMSISSAPEVFSETIRTI